MNILFWWWKFDVLNTAHVNDENLGRVNAIMEAEARKQEHIGILVDFSIWL